ncbi:NOT3 [Candida theae]|uniref:NOT3 n=1 Tax=Candida theae TaxID=1198502 RepID=A0AAD5FXZ8_9ASCO|nr:NOT3 [Candida theae]KAI5957444.1 NOT3 [Candida theae]
MANRKLQKDIDVIFKRIQEGLQDFNYHYERYESLTNTEDDSDNQREKEKLANDLKKEIKKLQKFREQIKHWLSNDAVNTLGPVGTSYSAKLSENKSTIEDAMETYKLVEKQTKLKSFSNQSIMMAFADNENGEEEEEESDEDESSEEEDESLYDELSEEAVDLIRYFKDSISQLREQTDKFTHEYEKLASKKLRKNNLATIEAKKEKIQATISNNKFHQKKLRKLIKQLKNGMVTDFNLIFALKNDLEAYLDKNGDTDLTKDTELYDDIFNQISAVDEDYSEVHEDTLTAPTSVDSASVVKNGHIEKKSKSPTPTKSSSRSSSEQPGQPNQTQQHQQHQQQPQHSQSSQQSQHLPKTHHAHSARSSDGGEQRHVSQTHSSTQAALHAPNTHQSPEMASPAIVRTLRPATTPSKPVGGLKWSAAAAVGLPETPEKPVLHDEAALVPDVATSAKREASVPFKQLELEEIDLDKYKAVISNSPLSKTEHNLFSDMDLVRVPPGIQDLVISFASKRNNEEFKILIDSAEFNQFTSPIYKPYLPKSVQPNCYSQFTNFSFKHPTSLSKFQSHWNKIRAYYGFKSLTDEIKKLSLQDSSPEVATLLTELTFVLFYGYYYGLTPAENLIAESCLFEIGWKPYKSQFEANNRSPSPFGDASVEKKSGQGQTSYWFKRLKLISNDATEGQQQATFEFGDYQVFDLNFWEIFVKYGFKLEYGLCQTAPSKTLF